MSSAAANVSNQSGTATSLQNFWNTAYAGNQPVTSTGKMIHGGAGNLVNWGILNPTNKTIGGIVSGALMDANINYMRMGQDLQYQKGQYANMLDYEGGIQNLMTGNTATLMGLEGNITKDLTKVSGQIGSRQIKEKGDQERRTARVLGDETRLGMMEEGSQNRMTLGAQGLQDRLLTKTKGSEDRLSRREQGSQDRMLTQTKGDQDRKTQRDLFRENRKMRADARGAIRSSGSRFFG
tara:strand:- start:8491 stop:9201 length:711 start_codon:yes stop_codon:yes gene_type:complete